MLDFDYIIFFFKQKTAYEMRISDWSSDVCSSDLLTGLPTIGIFLAFAPGGVAEMSLIALALSIDAALVATHHIVRIFLIVVLTPLLFRVLPAQVVGRPGLPAPGED